jgi:hypothetical protein
MVLVFPPFVLGVLRICSLADWVYQSGLSALFHPLTIPFAMQPSVIAPVQPRPFHNSPGVAKGKDDPCLLGLYLVPIPPNL